MDGSDCWRGGQPRPVLRGDLGGAHSSTDHRAVSLARGERKEGKGQDGRVGRIVQSAAQRTLGHADLPRGTVRGCRYFGLLD